MGDVVQLPYQEPGEPIEEYRSRRRIWRFKRGWLRADTRIKVLSAKERREIAPWQGRYLPMNLPLFVVPQQPPISLTKVDQEAS